MVALIPEPRSIAEGEGTLDLRGGGLVRAAGPLAAAGSLALATVSDDIIYSDDMQKTAKTFKELLQ
jgi:hypothetical protein